MESNLACESTELDEVSGGMRRLISILLLHDKAYIWYQGQGFPAMVNSSSRTSDFHVSAYYFVLLTTTERLFQYPCGRPNAAFVIFPTRKITPALGTDPYKTKRLLLPV